MEFSRIADKKRVDFIVGAIRESFPPGSQLLDYGCGNGFISRSLANAEFYVTAIDSSEETIARAKKINSHPRVCYSVLRTDGQLFQPEQYDVVILSEVLEHLPFPDQLLHAVYPALKPGGKLIVTVPNGFGPREMLVTRPVQALARQDLFFTRLLFNLKKRMGFDGVTQQSSAESLTHLQFFSIGQLRRLARKTGFKISLFRKGNFIEQVFPFSLIYRRSALLQRFDCRLADVLPAVCSSGWMMVWEKADQQV